MLKYIVYKLFVTRVYSEKTNSYYTTSYSIMSNKSDNDYALVFNKINDNIKFYLDIGEDYQINELHTDFEVAIGSGCRQIYPQVKIKYCIWHQLRAFEKKKIIYVKKI